MLDDFTLALAHYALQFPTLASLGTVTGPSAAPDAWKREYDRVVNTGFAPTLVTQTQSDGTQTTASRNFSQTVLLSALHTRRHQLDPTYTAPFETPPAITYRRLGITVRLGP